MMVLHLVKKEFLLVKKYMLTMIVIAVALPLFILWRVPVFTGFVSFLFTVFFTEFILCQSVSLIEAKYPKAHALLCAAPYSRSCVVKAKYVFFLAIFVLCLIIYSALFMLIPQIGVPDLSGILLVLLLSAIPYGIYMPFQFRFGYERTRIGFMIILFGLSFGVPTLHLANIKINLSAWEAVPDIVQCLILAGAVYAVLGISALASIRIYSKKDL